MALWEEGVLRRPPGRMRVGVNRADMRSTTQLGRDGVWRLLSRGGVLAGLAGVPSWAPPPAHLPPAQGAPSGPDQGALLALWNSLSPAHAARSFEEDYSEPPELK